MPLSETPRADSFDANIGRKCSAVVFQVPNHMTHEHGSLRDCIITIRKQTTGIHQLYTFHFEGTPC